MKNIEPKDNFFYDGPAPGDKSVTHRAVMLNSVAEGESTVRNSLLSLDTLATCDCMRRLGAGVEIVGSDIHITPVKAMRSGEVLDCANSGTTIRLLTGLLSSRGVFATLTGDDSLKKRPMTRVSQPLAAIGADVSVTDGRAPITVRPSRVTGGEVELEVASAQVKSALLLAGLCAENPVTVGFSRITRDHTERMLSAMGAHVTAGKDFVTVAPSALKAVDVSVCGDMSGAAFLLAAGILTGECRVSGVGINPTRAGVLEIFRRFGAKISVSAERDECGEPIADVIAKRSQLKPVRIDGDIVPNIIDELPIIAVLAAFAEGDTVVRDAAELRVKESDRIKLICNALRGSGVGAEELPDGFIVHGRGRIPGDPNFTVSTCGDHRIAMSMAVAGLASERGIGIDDIGCAAVSFPNFQTAVGI